MNANDLHLLAMDLICVLNRSCADLHQDRRRFVKRSIGKDGRLSKICPGTMVNQNE